jgi:hypothetical protein
MTLSCEDKVAILDNQFDPDNPEYTLPQVTFVSPSPQESEIVETTEVSFQWEGNALVEEYRNKFDNEEWKDWTSQASTSLQYLDEGPHIFSIQGRYASGDTSEIVSINFSVDAVEGPALMFFPRRHIASVGQTVSFQIVAEEVEDLAAAECTITFDPEILQITDVSKGSIFESQGESIFLNNYDNAVGTITLSTALLGGDNPAVNGTNDIAIIEMEVKMKGTGTLTIDGSAVFRNPNNGPILINKIINGLVEIE